MSEPVIADKCKEIADHESRLICEICRPNDQGRYIIPTNQGNFTPDTYESCALILPSLSRMGFKLLMDGRTTPASSGAPETNPATGPAEAPSAVRSEERASGDEDRQIETQERPEAAYETSPAARVETEEAGGNEGPKVIKPFAVRIVTDGRTSRVSRQVLFGNGKGCKLTVEFSVIPSEQEGSYTMTYSIYKSGAPFEILRKMSFTAQGGKANLGFEISSSSSDMSRIDSIRIVDLGR